MTTKAEKDHMGRVAALGCVVCRNNGFIGTPPEIQHIIDIHNRDRNHLRVIPLCTIHHRTGLRYPLPYIKANDLTGWARWREVGYHQTPKEFKRRYGAQRDLLKQVEDMLTPVA